MFLVKPECGFSADGGRADSWECGFPAEGRGAGSGLGVLGLAAQGCCGCCGGVGGGSGGGRGAGCSCGGQGWPVLAGSGDRNLSVP